MKKIVICASPHTFGAIEAPARMIADGLRAKGCQVEIFFLDKNLGAKEFVKYIKNNDVDGVLALNPSVLRLRYRFSRILSYIKTKLFVFMLDDPAYHFKAIEYLVDNASAGVFFLLPELNQKLILDQYVLDRRLKGVQTFFFPWAGPDPLLGMMSDPKPYELAVFCTLDQQIAQGVKFAEFVSAIQKKYELKNLENLLNSLFVSRYIEPISSFVNEISGSKFQLNDGELLNLWMELDSLLKEHRRLMLARELINIAEASKIKMIICGTGWDKLGDLPETITLAGPVHYDRQFEIFKNSKFVVNLDPNWTNGIHDRVFNAMSVGCAVITNENMFALSEFTNGKTILSFSEIGELSELVLQHDAKEIAQNAMLVYQAHHTWASRVDKLMQCLD